MVPKWGALIRVFDGNYKKRLQNFSRVTQCPVVLTTFFPVRFAVKQGIVDVVDYNEVRPDLRDLPKFREYADIDRNGNVRSWWIESSSGVIKKTVLSPEEEKLPIRAVLNDTALIEAIENHNEAKASRLLSGRGARSPRLGLQRLLGTISD